MRSVAPAGNVTDGTRAAAAARGVYALLADGTTALIRAASPADKGAVRRMHEALSPDNAYLRFFAVRKDAAKLEADRACREPADDHLTLLAWLADELAGLASLERTGPAAGEIAFAVADHAHGRGIATLLLEHLVSGGRSLGMEEFTAQVLIENTAMLRVFADAGLHPQYQPAGDGVTELTFRLPASDTDPGLEMYRQAVAEREQHADVESMRCLLAPSSVAVIGAGRREGSPGRAILRNIVTGGYGGHVYAVNPHAAELEGITCVQAVADLPQPIDVAVVAVPAAGVVAVAEECGRRGVKALVVITAGLNAAASADLLAVCRRHGMRLVGPNCFGMAVPGTGLDATFAAQHPAPGCAGLAVQSGGVGIVLLEQLSRLGIGVSSFLSLGDKLDVSGNDLLMCWEQDPATSLAVLYLESFGNPRKFARTARRAGRTMPVLTVHAGRSDAGQRAAASHTAAAATPLVTRQALFEQAGIVATASLGELIDTTALLATQPVPAGNRVAIVSNAGGAGVLAADACTDAGLRIAAPGPATQSALRALLPAGAAVGNPVDTGAAVAPGVFRQCVELLAADNGIDVILALTVPTAVGDLVPAVQQAAAGKTLALAALGQPETIRLLPPQPEHAGTPPVPAYAYPETAARALAHAARYGTWRARPPGQVPTLAGIDTCRARALIQEFLRRVPGGGWLTPAEVATLLSSYGIPLVATHRADSEESAAEAASQLGMPVVLKADVPGLVHKSDAGAVLTGLRDIDEVRHGYRQLAEKFAGRLAEALVQPMVTGGTEVIIGVTQEPVFGPLVVFGLGGTATEVLGDHAARLTPLTDTDAGELIRSIRGLPLLLGHRGTPPADTGALADIALRVSQLADELPEVAELDLNPVIALPKGACPVDARVRVVPARPLDPFLRRLR